MVATGCGGLLENLPRKPTDDVRSANELGNNIRSLFKQVYKFNVDKVEIDSTATKAELKYADRFPEIVMLQDELLYTHPCLDETNFQVEKSVQFSDNVAEF